jgi:hypothetical protein
MDQVKEYAPIAQQIAGTVLTSSGENNAGNAAYDYSKAKGNVALARGEAIAKLADFKSRQMEQNAGQQIAAGTHLSEEEQRKSDLIASRAMAVAAASGGGALDPTVVRILQGVSQEGSLASRTQMYNAEESARGMRANAAATRYEGRISREAAIAEDAALRSEGKAYQKVGKSKALTTILSGINKMVPTWGSADDSPNSLVGLDQIGPDHSFDYYYDMSRA